jgi:hypothetical protein
MFSCSNIYSWNALSLRVYLPMLIQCIHQLLYLLPALGTEFGSPFGLNIEIYLLHLPKYLILLIFLLTKEKKWHNLHVFVASREQKIHEKLGLISIRNTTGSHEYEANYVKFQAFQLDINWNITYVSTCKSKKTYTSCCHLYLFWTPIQWG